MEKRVVLVLVLECRVLGKLSPEYIGPPYTPGNLTSTLAENQVTEAVEDMSISTLRAELKKARLEAKAACSGSKSLPTWITAQSRDGHEGVRVRHLGPAAAVCLPSQEWAWSTGVAAIAGAMGVAAGYVVHVCTKTALTNAACASTCT
jgi:hypothetical protein